MLGSLIVAALLSAGSTEEQYESARTQYRALMADPARQRLRHHWLGVAERFEQVATQNPKATRAPDALFTVGMLHEGLFGKSGVRADAQEAVAFYRRVLEAHAQHRLADDAALAAAHLLAKKLDRPQEARELATAGLKVPRGDRGRELRALLDGLPKPAQARRTAVKDERAPSRRGRTHQELSDVFARVSAVQPVDEVKAPGRRARAEASSLAPRPGSLEAPRADDDAHAEARAEADDQGTLAAPIACEGPPCDPSMTDLAEETSIGALQERLRQVRFGPALEGPPPAVAALKRARNVDAGAVTEQLGLKFRRVVIDAGHGGKDTGAIGPSGVREKDVTLAIALGVARRLRAAGLQVVLTRSDDATVALEDRSTAANEARGDVFVSIHCNSAPSARLRGIETYTLNVAADRYAVRLARRENATATRGASELQLILADLATKANTEDSNRLAALVQGSLVKELSARHRGIKNLGKKEALFHVLLGAKMPAILVETSFLSHPEEERRLASKSYQEDLAEAIAAGVRAFTGDRERLAQVD